MSSQEMDETRGVGITLNVSIFPGTSVIPLNVVEDQYIGGDPSHFPLATVNATLKPPATVDILDISFLD